MRNWQPVIGFVVSMSFTACNSLRPPMSAPDRTSSGKIVATYSIVAFDPATGDLGISVQSRFFGVGSVVPWAKGGVGAVATQASANVTYGPRGLKLLEDGKDAGQVIKLLTSADGDRDVRQCGIVDAHGRSATFTGAACNPFAGGRTGKHFAVQGNILAGERVLDAMAEAYETAQKAPGGELADWLVAALQAGEDAGGDSRGRQSAALLVVRKKGGYGGASDRYIDLRVEDHSDPTMELSRLLALHKDFYPALHLRRPKRSQRVRNPPPH